MKKIVLLFLFWLSALFSMQAQINSNSPATPFGSRTSYSNGIMPSNLPSGGTFGASQAAADAYNAWKTKFVVTCSGSGSRVLFDDGSSTVSEGIGYGMLLSAYAGDKPTFDLLWQFYKAHENGKGLMNWKYSNCTSIASGGQNGATDADEDAAMALIVANSQWPTATSPYSYKTEATTLLNAIRLNEFSSNYQPVNGDGWGTTNACRNPSYMAPGYYTEFASFDGTNSSFWTSCASAVNTVLLGNRNATTGLVSNWCSNTTPYADNNCNNSGNGYGYDACRNPWRMSVDVLWHGSTAVTASSDICSKLSTWLKGYESSLKGPYSNQTAANPSAGQYANGSFSTFALAPMATNSTNQSSLNSCYTSV
jgi:endo-1,4-beta-D-glucanase Y